MVLGFSHVSSLEDVSTLGVRHVHALNSVKSELIHGVHGPALEKVLLGRICVRFDFGH